MSSAPGTVPQPALPATSPPPAIVSPGAKPPGRGSRLPFILAGIVAIGVLALGLWRYQKSTESQRSKAAAFTSVRTATVSKGDIVQTLRLTGTTGAEKFASL